MFVHVSAKSCNKSRMYVLYGTLRSCAKNYLEMTTYVAVEI